MEGINWGRQVVLYLLQLSSVSQEDPADHEARSNADSVSGSLFEPCCCFVSTYTHTHTHTHTNTHLSTHSLYRLKINHNNVYKIAIALKKMILNVFKVSGCKQFIVATFQYVFFLTIQLSTQFI